MAVTGTEPISAANLKQVVDQLKNELGGGSCSLTMQTARKPTYPCLIR